MISRKGLDELIQGYTDAAFRMNEIGHDLEDLSILAIATSPWSARRSSDIIDELNNLYMRINGAINFFSSVTPND